MTEKARKAEEQIRKETESEIISVLQNFGERLEKLKINYSTLQEQIMKLSAILVQPAQAIKLFLKQVADTQTVPLSFNYHQNSRIPNAATLKAIAEARAERKTAQTYATFEEAMQHLED